MKAWKIGRQFMSDEKNDVTEKISGLPMFSASDPEVIERESPN